MDDGSGGNLGLSGRLLEFLQVSHPLLLHLEHDGETPAMSRWCWRVCSVGWKPSSLSLMSLAGPGPSCPGEREMFAGRAAPGKAGVFQGGADLHLVEQLQSFGIQKHLLLPRRQCLPVEGEAQGFTLPGDVSSKLNLPLPSPGCDAAQGGIDVTGGCSFLQSVAVG
ncbi:hypothetical protein E2C01_082132 [Portunus trituberculatus]|uniref:Uncharacterized protein n=1 Tax=Portunus trituberculatus TaxID=210409 RepID=A0A5B7J432_PORTR|nr:hypothetical protein [Portunus trituberculatus]